MMWEAECEDTKMSAKLVFCVGIQVNLVQGIHIH